jgi:CBS domain containing-hemolysin-like protein
MNGFFVLCEYSLMSLRKSRLEDMQEKNIGNFKLLTNINENKDKYFIAIQIGITMSSLFLGWYAYSHLSEALLKMIDNNVNVQWFMQNIELIKWTSIVVSFFIVTFLHVIFAEMIPKTIAIREVDNVIAWVAYPLKLFVIVLAPIITGFTFIFHKGLNILGFKFDENEVITHSENELRSLLTASERGGVLDHVESKLIDNVFDFSDTVVREVMVPRQDMVPLFVNKSFSENMKIVNETSFTRYPLCFGDRDHVIGVIHIKDLMNLTVTSEKFDFRSIMRDILVVPEGMPISSVLQGMQRRHIQMAVVADEYGGVAGIATMEDVIEEIVGDIQDEHDTDEAEIKSYPDGSYIFDGLVTLDDVEDLLNIKFDEPEEDTIGGYVFGLLGRKPLVGDSVKIDKFIFEVLVSTGFRVVKVKVSPIKEKKVDAISDGE